MSDQNAAPAPPLVVNIQYVKDLSFEVPGAPAIYTQLRNPPRVDINLDVQARRINDQADIYEVVLAIRAEATEANAEGNTDGQRVFVAELSYGGVFTLTNVPDEAIEPILLVECPKLLFPSPATSSVTPPAKAAFRRFCSTPSISWRCGSPAGRLGTPESEKEGQGPGLPSLTQIATRTPSSTTRSLGMRKNSVAGVALRARIRNSHIRQIGIFGAIARTSVSRPRK